MKQDQPVTKDTLTPCPWCGEHLTVQFVDEARCDTKGCWMHERKLTVVLGTIQATEWNTRTGDQALRDALTVEQLYELVRPIWHYAKPGQPDALMFDKSERGILLRRSVERLAAALSQETDRPVPEYGKIHTDGSRSGGQPPKAGRDTFQAGALEALRLFIAYDEADGANDFDRILAYKKAIEAARKAVSK